MRYCSKCGYKLEDDQLYCPKCGNKEPLITQDYDADQNMTSYKREKMSIETVNKGPEGQTVITVSAEEQVKQSKNMIGYLTAIITLSFIIAALSLFSFAFTFVKMVMTQNVSKMNKTLPLITNSITLALLIGLLVVVCIANRSYTKVPGIKFRGGANLRSIRAIAIMSILFTGGQIPLILYAGVAFTSIMVGIMGIACGVSMIKPLKSTKLIAKIHK